MPRTASSLNVAKRMSSSLDTAASLLDSARDKEAFLAAIRVNRAVWLKVRGIAPRLGWPVPRNVLEFSISVTALGRPGINDHDVETLIHINRTMSRSIAEWA